MGHQSVRLSRCILASEELLVIGVGKYEFLAARYTVFEKLTVAKRVKK
jgi:hypothetical protein